MTEPQAHTIGKSGRGSLIQRSRLISGLILMAYVTSHFANHMLGHISLEAMEAFLIWQSWIWQSYIGSTLLYGALGVHVLLAIWRITKLNTLRLPLWEWAQILLGVAIPYWLVSHITFTRFAENELGIDVDYNQELALIWTGAEVTQTLLMIIVWAHGCIGIHFWLRIRDGYPRWQPILAAVATLVPVLSITGWISAARRQQDSVNVVLERIAVGQGSPEDVEAMEMRSGILRYVIEALVGWQNTAQTVVIGIGIALVLFLLAKFIASQFREQVKVTYGDGAIVSSAPGATILEASRQAGIPHMSVCGGRARCSTCRTLVTNGNDKLSHPAPAELELLAKLNAPTGVRLGCQARMFGDVEVRPLIQPQQHLSAPRNADPLGWGVERDIAVFFLDIRGFSKISEKSLPYDVVFILNSFFGEVSNQIEEANGYVDKFMGDGLMALFGLSSDTRLACVEALTAAANAHRASERVSELLTQHIDEPIKIGIGIHVGTAVVGRIGKTADQTSPSRLTAIGDTVNIAARLESATKELKTPIVISQDVAEQSALEGAAKLGDVTEINVHNIAKPIDVIGIKNLEALEKVLGLTK